MPAEAKKQIENDLTQGKVLTKLLGFALPYMASNLIQSFYSIADVLIVGRLCGTISMSGVVIGSQVTFILTTAAAGFCMGGTVVIGRHFGAGNHSSVDKASATLITLFTVLALVITPLLLIFRAPLLELIHTPAESFSETSRYFTATVAGIIFIFGYNVLASIIRGMGNSKQPFYFVLIACILSIFLDFLFEAVFKLRALGAAMSTVISQAFSVYLCIRYLKKRKFSFDFKLHSFKIDWKELKFLVKFGLPACIQNSIISLSFMFISATVNYIGGVSASAGVGAVLKFRRFVSLPVISIGTSISTMCAQNFGANLPERAKEACKYGIIFSVCISYVIFILVQIFPISFLKLFGNDPSMIRDGAIYMRTYSYDLLIFPLTYCFNSYLIGKGHTLFALINSLFSSILLRAPASYFFGITLDLGLYGVGLGNPVASAWVLLAIYIFLRKDKWDRSNPRYEQDIVL